MYVQCIRTCMPRRSVAELNRAIKETEFSISHSTLTRKEEQAALDRMREMNKGRKTVSAYEVEAARLEEERTKHHSQTAVIRASIPVDGSLSVDALKASASEKSAIMDKLMASRQELREQKDELRSSLDEIKAQLDLGFTQVCEKQSTAPDRLTDLHAY